MPVTKPTKTIFEIKQELEKNPMVQEYISFLALPSLQKRHIWESWDAYYIQARETVAYELYKAIEEAFRARDMKTFDELQAQLKDMREKGLIPELVKPKSIDPEEFNHNQVVLRYKSVVSAAERTRETGLEF